jgi:spermidine/putrescine transport system permease protein
MVDHTASAPAPSFTPPRWSKSFDLKRQPGFGVVAVACMAVLYAPIVILVVFSFNASRSVTRWSTFSLDWYASALADGQIHDAARNSIMISLVAMIVSSILATAAALATTRSRPWPGIAISYTLINLPLMVPEIVTAVATLSFFSLWAQFGVNMGIVNLMIAHTVFCIPFAYMPIRARLEDMDLTLEQAAADLYARPWQAFRYVTLPLLMPGVTAGAVLAFIVSFDDFTITQLVAGPGQTTLPLAIWGKLQKSGVTPEVNAVSAILLLVSILITSLSFIIGRKRKK